MLGIPWLGPLETVSVGFQSPSRRTRLHSAFRSVASGGVDLPSRSWSTLRFSRSSFSMAFIAAIRAESRAA